ncbi:MAG: amino-acid racemase [Firmicutes bacterium HGW-Firmicutes-7]|nr:MAG: amino-acid racemase [Firmicutes bacterium HGW-Firmicutes-7]
MFLKKTIERNHRLVELAMEYISTGQIQPDTYVIDMDSLLDNAKEMLEVAKKSGIRLYFMTKQIGRNPYIASKLMELGFDGAVCVDYKEAQRLGSAGIKIGHVGHLVQIPKKCIKEILMYKPEIITVYSYDKAQEVSEVAIELDMQVDLMLRVVGDDESIYEGQKGGLNVEELEDIALKINKLENVKIVGITAFPCFLYDSDKEKVIETTNIKAIQAAKLILEKIGINLKQINLPSNTSVESIKMISYLGGTHGEPGHSLTGTTPGMATSSIGEIPSIVYASEISHTYGKHSYFYGGGHYRRSFVKNALVGKNLQTAKMANVLPLEPHSIDYYFELDTCFEVSVPVILAFRTQVFVTRSEVALVEGLHNNQPKIVRLFDALGNQIGKGV